MSSQAPGVGGGKRKSQPIPCWLFCCRRRHEKPVQALGQSIRIRTLHQRPTTKASNTSIAQMRQNYPRLANRAAPDTCMDTRYNPRSPLRARESLAPVVFSWGARMRKTIRGQEWESTIGTGGASTTTSTTGGSNRSPSRTHKPHSNTSSICHQSARLTCQALIGTGQ